MLTIGKVARLAEVGVDTIRYYEKAGLLAPARKSPAGYRLYSGEAVRRLGFIRHAQQCGFSLAEIRELLELKTHGDGCCTDVRSVVIQKKLQIESKIKALKTMSQALNQLIEVCSHDAKPLDECPILAALESSIAGQNARSGNPAK
ncbi:MAG: heavy metal-responsive transcriptional regulator [Stutzerimonas stutzeri]|nr:MAG: heavy metal-responsive transcriptional regulator [Stutzerimonas stutzeri]